MPERSEKYEYAHAKQQKIPAGDHLHKEAAAPILIQRTMFEIAQVRSACCKMMCSARRSDRVLIITTMIIAEPEMACCQNGEMFITGSAFSLTPRNRAPITAPATELMPLAIDLMAADHK